MAAAPDTANVTSASATSNPAANFNCTCAASDNLLVVLESNYSTTLQAPSAMTYNGVSMTLLSSKTTNVGGGQGFESSIWYLVNPPTGTAYAVAQTITGANVVVQGIIAVPYSGASGSFGTAATAGSSANNTAAITATGGGSN